jgi:hypothetical protein
LAHGAQEQETETENVVDDPLPHTLIIPVPVATPVRIPRVCSGFVKVSSSLTFTIAGVKLTQAPDARATNEPW